MIRVIRPDYAAPLGDIRRLGLGDVVQVEPGATKRKDWGRYESAIGQAVARGAEVRRTAQKPESDEARARREWEGKRRVS